MGQVVVKVDRYSRFNDSCNTIQKPPNTTKFCQKNCFKLKTLFVLCSKQLFGSIPRGNFFDIRNNLIFFEFFINCREKRFLYRISKAWAPVFRENFTVVCQDFHVSDLSL